MRALTRAIGRWGGVLVDPRATVADSAREDGRFDELWMFVFYVCGSQVWALMRALAGAIAVSNGVWLALAAIGQALAVPVIASFAVDFVLGRSRRYRRGVCLVPVVVCGTLGHAAAQLGWWRPSPSWLAGAIGVLAAVAMAWWIRPVIALDSGVDQGER